MPRYGPPDAFETPRFSGPRTFMRLPYVRDLDGVDVAIVGIPTDGAVVYRSGARFGPEGIRSVSVTLRNYNPMLTVDVVEKLSARGRFSWFALYCALAGVAGLIAFK